MAQKAVGTGRYSAIAEVKIKHTQPRPEADIHPFHGNNPQEL
jgi:hypothetical protein